MPIPPLVAMFQSPAIIAPTVAASTAASAAPVAQALIDEAIVLAVYESGVLTVQHADGRVVDALQATDEPLRAGQGVWVAPTTTTPVVLGSS
jgi:hypothetical protein